MYKVYAITDIGMQRNENQDGFCVDGAICTNVSHREVYYETDSRYIHVAICDGVGSTKYANYAVKKTLEYMACRKCADSEKDITAFVNNMNSYVYKSAIRDQKEDCATTVVGFVINEGIAYSYNIGDSVSFTINNGYLEKRSVDDTGMESVGIVENYGEKTVREKPPLLQSIGTNEFLDYVHVCKVDNEDVYLLSTDGITDMLSLDEIEDIISDSDGSLKAIARKLVDTANEKGGPDNATVIIVVDEQEG